MKYSEEHYFIFGVLQAAGKVKVGADAVDRYSALLAGEIDENVSVKR